MKTGLLNFPIILNQAPSLHNLVWKLDLHVISVRQPCLPLVTREWQTVVWWWVIDTGFKLLLNLYLDGQIGNHLGLSLLCKMGLIHLKINVKGLANRCSVQVTSFRLRQAGKVDNNSQHFWERLQFAKHFHMFFITSLFWTDEYKRQSETKYFGINNYQVVYSEKEENQNWWVKQTQRCRT